MNTGVLMAELLAAEKHNPEEFSRRLIESGVTAKQFKQRRSLWEADHLTPVAEGGGECGLDNLITRCIPCHKAKTKEDMARIRAAKKANDE
jgi:5-methylcytosine-specific restriction endonuclease McrA